MDNFNAENRSGCFAENLKNELNRLVSAGKSGDLNVSFSYENLNSEEMEVAKLINQAVQNYRSALEYELVKYQLTNTSLGIAQWDMEIVGENPISPDTVITWSQEVRQLLGFENTQDFPNVMQSMNNRVPPEDLDETLSAIRAHLNDRTGKTPYDIEHRAIHKNGQIIYLHVFGTSQRDNSGNPLRFAGAFRDITKRKQMENTISLEKERITLMIDSSPLCMQIWDRDLNTIDCNEAGVKLYRFKDKQEYTERFIAECSPEYQPDGQRSDVKAVALVNEAFEKGYCRFDWMHRIPEDDIVFPAEITLVRAKYSNEDVVIGYTRDLREHNKMLLELENQNNLIINASEQMKRRDNLLRAVNKSAVLLLTTDVNEDVEASIITSMELVGQSVEADRVHIWRNVELDGRQQFLHIYEWLSDVGRSKSAVSSGIMAPYDNMSDWLKRFEHNEHIGGPLAKLSESEQEYFKDFDIKSVFLIPLFLDNNLWGLVSIDDCQRERDLTKDEISILRSVSLMMASAINRHALVAKRTHELAIQTSMLSTLFDSIPDHIFVKDLNHRFVQCNRSLLEFYGMSSEDLVGKADDEGLLVSKEQADRFTTWDRRVIAEKETYTIEDVIVGRDGKIRYSETIKTPLIINDNVIGVLGISRDITERKEAERRTAMHHEYATSLTDTLAEIAKSPDISTGDLKSTVDTIIREGCIALGVSYVSVWRYEKKLNILTNVSCYTVAEEAFSLLPDFDLKTQPRYLELLQTERLIVATTASELPLKLQNEEPSELCALLDAPIRVEGKLVGVICIEQNRSEEYPVRRKWLPEELSFASSMADFIALAVTGFERHMALEEAKRANKAKSGFLASMSHEIRTPMNAILGITEILVQNEHLPADIREGLDRIYTSCDLLLGIINEILDLSRIEAGKMEIVPAQYSTASMLNDSIQLNLVRLGEKPIEFLIDVCENTPVNLIGDEMRIKQILNNMLSNAIKYTESGKITLSVTTEPRPGYEEQLTLVLSVRDTGCGMTKAQLDRVFDEYSRFERNQENFIEGTGLGLAITQRLLRLMGGEIYVESTPGVGSLFVARFPQQTVECDVLGKETASKLSNFEYTANTCRDRRKSVRDYMPYGSVLIVDDVETNRFVAAGLMKLFKLQIETVDSGIKAIDIIKSGKVYDIVFMDHMMPEMDGIEVTGRLRELGYEAPIVALTANVVAGQTDVFLQNGFNDVVAKPIDIRLLTYVLNRFIRDKQPPEVIEAARQMQINETSTDGSDGKSGGAVNAAHAHIAGKLLRKRVAGLDVAKGLDRYNNDVETYLGILTSYANTIDTLLNEIENFSEYKLPYYIIKVHGIKGASYDIYANPTGKVAERLEEAAENSDFEYIRKNNRKFIKATRKFILSIKDTLLDVGAESLSAKKDKPDSELLSKLISACEVYDMDGISSVMTEIEKHQYSSDDGLVNWLREKVKQMSFSEIIEKLSG